jgi:hypothetical protein
VGYEYEMISEPEIQSNNQLSLERIFSPLKGDLKEDSEGKFYCKLGTVIQIMLRIRTKCDCYHVYLYGMISNLFLSILFSRNEDFIKIFTKVNI